jgi:uncharacterized Zn finger protein (UPF0148 family)
MTIYCPICDDEFEWEYPFAGNSVCCPKCGSTGYGTYDMNGDPMIEWDCIGDGGSYEEV